jgi:protein TonB
MAPQAKLEESIPATLPDNFDAWDSGEPPATLPDDFDSFDDTFDADNEEPAASAAAVLPSANKGLDTAGGRAATATLTVMPAPDRAQETKSTRQPVPAQAKPETVVSSYKQNAAKAEPEAKEQGKRKKPTMMLVIGPVVLVVLILAVVIPMMLRKAPAKAAEVSVRQPLVSYTPNAPPSSTPTETQSKPTPAMPLQTTAATPATTAPTEQTPTVQPDMMNSQLNAPSRISSDIKSPPRDAAPPPASFTQGGLEGLGGSSGAGVGTVFGGQSGPKVKIATPKFVAISSGVAQGMLVQRTTPVYPPIAKTARVAGTVVLQATISKNGTVEGLRVVSGPEMLRQSAVDAVRNWRYKPYKLNNDPVEVETTVSVVFSLGG